ncbi:Zinc finger protein [Phytophthora cinnamomi]|uniref:Zinc finger protein n=1 Tax=Phytophthora cinnamomi TaxID=4785 RepID=UPI003559747E|nr:Zinc finger protein [Phytophthora cinnamomi]
MKFHYGGAAKVCLVPGCGKTFSTTGNLNRHLKHQHPDLPAGQLEAVQQTSPAPPQVVITVPQVMPPQFLHCSPTSAEQWPVTVPVFKPRVAPCWPQQMLAQQQPMLPPYGQQVSSQAIYSPTRSCSELFEDVWNSEMLDTLVSALHDPTVRC